MNERRNRITTEPRRTLDKGKTEGMRTDRHSGPLAWTRSCQRDNSS